MNSSIEPTVSISLTFKRAADALDFYSKAFGAVELFRMSPAEGVVSHAEFMIGNTHMLMSDESPMWQASAMPEGTMASCLFAINVDNVDEAFAKAIEAGATPLSPPRGSVLGQAHRHCLRSIWLSLESASTYRGRFAGRNDETSPGLHVRTAMIFCEWRSHPPAR